MPLCFAAVSRRVVLSAFLALAAEPLLAADDSAAPAQALLAEGKAEEALTLCTAGLAKDATNVALLHTAAEASIALKQPAKAIGFLERAFAAAPKDRSVVHNLARSLYRADAQPRAIKLVRDHLAAHPKVLDEPLLDQLLYMIASADEPTRKLKAVADAAAFAEQYTKSLEAQRPGERRWGATWRPAQEVVELERQNQDISEEIAKADAELKSDEKEIAALKQQTAKIQARVKRGLDESYVLDDHLARIETMIKEGREKERIRAVRADSMAKPLAPPEPEWLALGTAVPPLTAKSEEVAVAPDPAIDPEISKLWETEGAAGDGMTSPEPTAPLIEEPRQEEAQQVTLDGVAVAIASDTLLTASSIVDGATEITVTDWLGKSDTATVIRTDAAAGLSLLRLSTIKAISLPVAATFAGGEVDCLSVNTGGLFQGETVGIGGTTAAPSENWTVSLSKSLKKSGAPLVSRGEIVGIALGTDNTKPDSVPAITRDELVRFIGKDAGKRGAAAKDPKQAVFHISVAR